MGPVGAMPLWTRDAASELKSASSTFTSWDKCMQKAYCKWPVIVGIVVGCLIVLSAAWCLISCLCCGAKCCQGCLSCCTCCCPSGGRGGGGRRSKYAEDPSYHHPPPPPPANASYGYQAPPAPPVYRGPQVAQFDTGPGKKVSDDALPAMPSWQTATTRRIEDTAHQDDVEMDQLNPSVHPTDMVQGPGRRAPGGYSQVPSQSASPPTGYRPPQRAMEQVAPYPPQPSRSPAPARSYGPPLDTSVGGVAYNQPYGRNSPYQDQSPRQGGPNFNRPQPYGQTMSPVSPPRVQPPYGEMQRRPTYASSTAPPSYTTEPPQQNFGRSPVQQQAPYSQPQSFQQPGQAPSQRGLPYPTEQRQPTYAVNQQQRQPAYNAYSPPAASSPPPAFETDPLEDSGRPPSLLQVGRKPAPNTWRNV